MKKKQFFYIQSHRVFKRSIMIIIIFFFQFSSASKPTPQEIDRKLKELYNANYSQSMTMDAMLKTALQCYSEAKGIGYEKGMKKSGLYASLLYSNTKDYENSIKISNEIESLMGKGTDYRSLSEYYKSRALNYSFLGLFKESYNDYQKAVEVAKKIDDIDIRKYMISVLYLDISNYYDKIPKPVKDSVLHYLVKALQTGEKIKKTGNFAKTGERNEWIINLNYFMGSYYLGNAPPNMILARRYFIKAKDLYEDSSTKMILNNEINFLSYLCQFYYRDHNYNEAIKYGLKSLELQKKEPVPVARKIVYESIAKAYLKVGKQKEYQNYIDRYIALNDSLDYSEKAKTSSSIEKFIYEKDQANIRKNSKVLYIYIVVTILIFLALLFIWKQINKRIHNNYLSIIESIIERIRKEEEDNNSLENTPIKIITSFNIPDDTHQKILIKLERFEKNLSFLKKDLTLSFLSNQFKTNPKTLSYIIKASRDKNYNSYINGLKINYITKKLYVDRLYREFKVSYLAEECGYSSAKVFVISFKKETGVTPSYYISNLKKDMGG